MPDQHHRSGGLGKCPKPFEQFPFRGGVELSHEFDAAVLAERGLDRFERLARAKRGRAERESWTDPLPAQVLGDASRRAFASRRERAVDVGKGRIGPARLPVSKQDDRSHRLTVLWPEPPLRSLHGCRYTTSTDVTNPPAKTRKRDPAAHTRPTMMGTGWRPLKPTQVDTVGSTRWRPCPRRAAFRSP